MLQLRSIMNEFDYGRRPLDDPQGWKPEDVQLGVHFLKSRYGMTLSDFGLEGEPNTEDEKQLIAFLEEFFDMPEMVANKAKFADMLSVLVKVKSKFPKLLDPAQGTPKEFIWRGATITRDIFMDLNWKVIKKADPYLVATSPIKPVKPRSDRGVHSFTAVWQTAWKFANRHNIHPNMWRIPCVFKISVKDKNTLFNPMFLNTIGMWSEFEVLYVGDSFKPIEYQIPSYVIKRIMSLQNKADQTPEVAAFYSKLTPMAAEMKILK